MPDILDTIADAVRARHDAHEASRQKITELRTHIVELLADIVTLEDQNAAMQAIIDATPAPGEYVPTVDLVGHTTPQDELERIDGTYRVTEGGVIAGKWFTGKIERRTNEPVLFVDCLFTVDDVHSQVVLWDGNTAVFTFEDCTFRPNGDGIANAITGHHYTTRRCHILDVSDGLGIYWNDATKRDGDMAVLDEASIIGPLSFTNRDPNKPEGTHNDCLQLQGGHGVEVNGSLYIATKIAKGDAIDPDLNPYWPDLTANAAIMVSPNVGKCGITIRNLTIEGGAAGINIVDNKDGTPVDVVIENTLHDYDGVSTRTGKDIIMHRATFGAATVSGAVKADGSPAVIKRG